MFYAADALSGRPPVSCVVLVAAVVYTVGEMTAGPVVSALSAEMPPPDQRGRYMAATQLAWSTSAAIAPLLYSALLDRGALAAWAGPFAVCVVWLALVQVLARRDAAGGPSGHQRRRARAGSGRLDRRGTVDLVARFVRARAKRVARDTAYWGAAVDGGGAGGPRLTAAL